MLRCKFKCIEKTEHADDSANIKMVPVCCGSSENEQFFKFTPSGHFSFGTVNPEAAKHIKQGKEYYIDIKSPEDVEQPTLKQSFEKICTERIGDPKYLCVAVQLPTGAIEIVTNTEKIGEKAKYYSEAYDECFSLKTNPAIKIVDFMII